MTATENQTQNPPPPSGYQAQYSSPPPGGPQQMHGQLPGRDPREKSPVLAGILSGMPGLGQIYVGYYQRGFTHALIAGGIITMLSQGVHGMEPLFGMFLGFFWLYNIIDAYRKASLYHQALAGGEEVELPADFKAPSIRGSLFGGVTLMSVGVIFLLNTRFGISMAWLHEWWPAAPILFGGYLVYKAVQEKNAEIAESAGEPKGD